MEENEVWKYPVVKPQLEALRRVALKKRRKQVVGGFPGHRHKATAMKTVLRAITHEATQRPSSVSRLSRIQGLGHSCEPSEPLNAAAGRGGKKVHWRSLLLRKASKLLLLLISASVVLTLIGVVSRTGSRRSVARLNITHVREGLGRHVFGQDLAIEKILRLLEEFHSGGQAVASRTTAMFLSGGSGTGKTRSSNLIVAGFPSKHVLMVFSGRYPHPQPSWGYRLVVVDDYEEGDEGRFLEFIAKLKASKTLVLVTTIVGAEIIDAMATKHDPITQGVYEAMAELVYPKIGLGSVAQVEVVPFVPLNRDTVRRCVGQSILHELNLHLPEVEMSKAAGLVMKELEFFPKESPTFSTSGCKKVHSKVLQLFRSPAKGHL